MGAGDSFYKKTVKDINIDGKTVLLRADYNVPLAEGGKITDDFRIKQSVPTVEYLLSKNCKVVICSHLGRPDGKRNKRFSLKPVAGHLEKLLGKKVEFAGDCVGAEAEQSVKALKPKQVLLLENLRFHAEEEANDDAFAKQLASLADVFVQDGFGVVHRAHASTDKVTKYLPSMAGLLLEKEVQALNAVIKNPKRPLMAIVGGAKISDKIDVLREFIKQADFVAIGGAMANTFLKAEGIETGKSLTDADDLPLAKDIMKEARAEAKKRGFIFYLPQDGVVAKEIDKKSRTRIVDWSAHVVADIENYPKRPPRIASRVGDDERILDIGPFSGAFIAGSMQLAGTVIWNGAMGITEIPPLQGSTGPFAHGTELIVEAMLGEFGHRPFSVVGGGDTVGYVEDRRLTGNFDHVSTGGGAALDLMAGKKLPGVEVLQDK